MVSVGTRPDPRNGSIMIGNGRLLALSGFGAIRPKATDSQVSENTTSSRKPIARTHSTGVADGRKPISSETPSMATTARKAWISTPSTCPVSSADCAMAMVRNRLTMPLVTSLHTETATDAVR